MQEVGLMKKPKVGKKSEAGPNIESMVVRDTVRWSGYPCDLAARPASVSWTQYLIFGRGCNTAALGSLAGAQYGFFRAIVWLEMLHQVYYAAL